MSDDPKITSMERDLERALEQIEDLRDRVNELEKESGMTNKAVELEVKALHQLASSQTDKFEDYAKSQVRETGKLSESHEKILSELGEMRGRISVIQDKVTEGDVEVNVGSKNATDGSGVIKWIVVAVGLVASIAIAFGGGYVNLPGGVSVGGAGQTPAPVESTQDGPSTKTDP